MKSKGFTLIELLVVIAIIGILSSVVLFSLQQARLKSQVTAYREYTKEVMKALELYKLANGSYPHEGEGNNEYLLSEIIDQYLASYISTYNIPSGLDVVAPGEITYQILVSAGSADDSYSCNRPLDDVNQRSIEPFILYITSTRTDLDLPVLYYYDQPDTPGKYCASFLAS